MGWKYLIGWGLVLFAALVVSIASVAFLAFMRSRRLTDKARRREVHRWEHQDVVDRHPARMA